jgi:hypothetical protein
MLEVEGGSSGSHSLDNMIVLLGKPEGKSPLGRPRSKWEVDLRVEYYGLD